jgi:hypothetical protein
MSLIQSYLHNLPNELFLNIVCKLTDIRDIIALLAVDNTISSIIQTDINYIIKKVSINNMNTYPQMYQIITYCYPNAPTIGNIRYNVGALAKIYEFIKSISKAEIIQQSNELVFNSLQFTPNQKATYYRLRVFNNISHYVSMMAATSLNIQQIVKMLNYIKEGINQSISFDIAEMNDQDTAKVFEIKERSVDIESAVRAVHELNETGITKMFKLIDRGVPPENAIDAVLDLNDEQIEVMFYLISKGISFDTARACGGYSEERQNTLIEIVSMGISDDDAFDVMQNYSEQDIKKFVKCFHHKIDFHFTEGILYLSENQINNFIELTENGIRNEFAETIAKNFDDEKIIKFINLIKKNVNEEIAYDAANLFNDVQISKFLNIIKSDINGQVAFNIIKFYNKLQTQVVINLVKNGIEQTVAFDFVEKYDKTNLSKFMDLIFDDIDVKTAMDIIISDNIEPSKKMQK